MTLVELQQILGENVEAIHNIEGTEEERAEAMEKGDMISRLAKQMINNADVILRTDKLISEGKLRNSTIRKVVGVDDKKETY